MQSIGEILRLSASDLVAHLNCRHLTLLDLAATRGGMKKPKFLDPAAELLRERGMRHEAAYIERLIEQGLSATTIDGVGVDASAVGETLSAMQAGAPLIVQGALEAGGYGGRTDVLLRVETPSNFGSWSYEVTDTKLARTTKGGTVLQLSLYSDLVAKAQGSLPERMHVVAPWTDYQPQSFRVTDYAAYYRKVAADLSGSIEGPATDTYPEPNPHCEVCDWHTVCDAKRRSDDHLSLVAGISKLQINELKERDVSTVRQLAAMPIPLTWKPERGSPESVVRIREQSRLQVEGRDAGETLYELLEPKGGFGLARLPEPSPGDIFLDFEGDPFVGEKGLEYLIGYSFLGEDGERTYIGDWALDREQERAAFERFVDFVMERREQHPDLHVYHYAPYEPAALKRLMGRYATREDQIDQLLRGQVLVDLYGVVRNALRASVESYSIKRLEPLYGYTRDIPLQEANRTLARLQAALELGDPQRISEPDQTSVEGYNKDDCVSTWQLRDWLEERRSELVASGEPIERPGPIDGAASQDVSAWQALIEALVSRLTSDVPADTTLRSAEQQARWILAHTLDWHRRELKAAWWEHFRLVELNAEDLLDERAALSGLEFVARIGGTDKAPVQRYRFPAQESNIRGGEDLRREGGERHGSVAGISTDERWVDIKKRQDSADIHAIAVYSHTIVNTDVLAQALVRIGEHVADHGLIGEGPYQAARDLLLRAPPRLEGAELQQSGEHSSDAAARIAPLLTGGVLAVQGPPGAGKTYSGARMIKAIVGSGAKVGISANSHKVIRNLLDEAIKTPDGAPPGFMSVEKVTDVEPSTASLTITAANPPFFDAMTQDHSVGAGTQWVWARAEAFELVDTLFIDEAAQMSLANVLAISQAARSLVLLGDPQQLEQPTQGSHPEGTEVSALDHILGGAQTIAEGQGLFLEETWRLHPDVCRFTSEIFYENRLRSRAGLEVQTVRSAGRMNGVGLRYLAVPHTGNQNSAPEEAGAIADLVNECLAANSTWVDNDGLERSLELSDILVIAPYNAQVFELQRALPGARVGTVDKFQGQQAAIVIYSMTTSSQADAPRGMEFLYSLNRLNVATSRAKCLCVLVGSPEVFEVECRTPRQMQLANAFCRYLELAALT